MSGEERSLGKSDRKAPADRRCAGYRTSSGVKKENENRKKFVTGIISTNCYIVTNEETKETVIVDPANLSKAMIGYIEEEELVIKAILLTHAQF